MVADDQAAVDIRTTVWYILSQNTKPPTFLRLSARLMTDGIS